MLLVVECLLSEATASHAMDVDLKAAIFLGHRAPTHMSVALVFVNLCCVDVVRLIESFND